MKKLILFILLFAVFAITNLQAQIYPTLDQRIGKVTVDTLTVGTTAVQVTSHPSAAWVQFMTEDATATVWYGGVGITSSTGWGALKQYDTSERYPVTNTKVFYLVSDEAGTIVKIFWASDGTVE